MYDELENTTSLPHPRFNHDLVTKHVTQRHGKDMTVVGDLDLKLTASCWSLGISLDNYLAVLPLCKNFFCSKTQGRGPSPEMSAGLWGEGGVSTEIHTPATLVQSSLLGSQHCTCASAMWGRQPALHPSECRRALGEASPLGCDFRSQCAAGWRC